MTTKKWNVGDLVRLKSGGPKMTVTLSSVGIYIACVWFDGAANREANFHPDVLEAVDSKT